MFSPTGTVNDVEYLLVSYEVTTPARTDPSEVVNPPAVIVKPRVEATLSPPSNSTGLLVRGVPTLLRITSSALRQQVARGRTAVRGGVAVGRHAVAEDQGGGLCRVGDVGLVAVLPTGRST